MEQLILAALFPLVAAGLYLWFRRRPPAGAVAPVAVYAPVQVPATEALPTWAEPPCPAELTGLVWRAAADLAQAQRVALLARYQQVPRPPRLLNQLLSREWINEAGARELAELIAAEPLLAARVLKAVNAPFYGLPRPVGSIAQAVTFLGLTAVRIVCLRYIFVASFKTDEPARQRALEQTWAASALASELMQRLAASLDPQGQLAGAVVLSFLGRLATVATLPLAPLSALPPVGRLARLAAEQDSLGLGAAEIGRLLMTHWQLPAAVVADAADIDAMVVCADASQTPERAAQLALGGLCVHLGEWLASGQIPSLLAYDLLADTAPELFRLRAALGPARWAELAQRLREPALAAGALKG